ncbi:DUF6988 family protein, partial [Vibrio cholerae]|uniref:DUF6988 family protein n=2 Tax=Vibrio cholerae TaxID=666 RepID=UPI001F3000B3
IDPRWLQLLCLSLVVVRCQPLRRALSCKGVQLKNTIGEKVLELLDGTTFQGSIRENFALMNHYMVFDTQRAIYDLVQLGHIGSAKALLRVIFEANVKGKWIYQCASEKQLEQLQKDAVKSTVNKKRNIQFSEMVDDVEKMNPNLKGKLKQFKEEHWKGLNSLTHTGVMQLKRYSLAFEQSGLETEIETILDFSNRMSISSLGDVGKITKNEAAMQASIDLISAL